MVWGLEYIAGFSPYQFDAIHIISSIVFHFLFGYIGARGDKEDKVQVALEVTAYTQLVSFALTLLGLPPLFLGVGHIVAFILVSKYVLKMNSFLKFSVFSIYLAYVFVELAMLDNLTRSWLLLIFILFMFLQSEVRVKRKKMESAKDTMMN